MIVEACCSWAHVLKTSLEYQNDIGKSK